MSDYSTVVPPQQNFNKSQAFAAALQRAKQIAAKINPTGAGGDAAQKRPLDDPASKEPEAKKSSRDRSRSPISRPAVTGLTSPAMVGQMPSTLGLAGPIGLGGPVSTEEIKVPDKMVGLIIGRGGEQITRLQSESGCKIQMAPDSGGLPDRVCSLTGNAAAIGRAKELVNAIVNQRYKTEGPDGPRINEIIPQHNSNAPFVEIMIPGPKVGLIIGKGGETIKSLQEKSGAKMVVIQDGPNQEAEKPLRITGDPQKVEHAKNLVYELLAEKDVSGGQSRGGRGGGRGGGSGSYDRGGGQQRNYGGRGQEESQFVVPANKCGVIIGRGGETIKQINQATGAHCELDRRPNQNPNEKVFIIRGSIEQIEAAKQMISDKLGQPYMPTAGPGANGTQGYTPGAPVGGPGAGYPGQWGAPQAPAYAQPYHQQHMDPNAMGGMAPQAQPQPDYSQQWIEYYRSLGMHSEADAIEQQTKTKQAAAAAAAAAAGGPGGPQPGMVGGPQGPGPQPGAMMPGQPQPVQPQPNPAVQQQQQQQQPQPQQQQANGQPDYSAQWAQYYRSLGKIKEAELIEQQMKNKQQQQQQQPQQQQMPGMPQPGGAPAPGAPQMPAAPAPAPGPPGQPGYYAPQPPAGPYGQPYGPGPAGYSGYHQPQYPGYPGPMGPPGGGPPQPQQPPQQPQEQ
ncbi:P-element somatic inhibitor isoform X3 [Rhodnius prolixus]|uniref:P-element somatic inhibitor isoform X3 n=1 Tax=Rhodnius prolixus TaxID=13249 RepID=UPI003D18AAEC